MPAQKRAGKRPRTQESARVRAVALAFEMEVPLNEAIDAAQALRFIGYGLIQDAGEEPGRAVAAIAWIACERLDALRETWRRLCKAAVRARGM